MTNPTDLISIKENKIILNAQGELPERQIAEVKDNVEESIIYFSDRFLLFEKKVEELKRLIDEHDNKGSFLVKLRHLKDQVLSFDGIGDYLPIWEDLQRYEQMLEDYIAQNRLKNTELKKSMLAELKLAAENPNWREATEQIKELKHRWIRVGAVVDELKASMEDEFNALVNEFFEKKRQFYLEKKEILDNRYHDYQQLIDKVEALSKESQDKWESAYEAIQEEWKGLANLPKIQYDELFEAFKKAAKPVHLYVKSLQNKTQIADREDALKTKKAIIEELKVISSEDEIGKEQMDRAKKSFEIWKSSGRVDAKKQAKLNEDFFFFYDMIMEKNFLHQLALKKQRADEPLDKLKIKLLYELLKRDRRELETFELNLDKFSLGAASLDKMVGQKYEKQKRKVKVKEALLQSLKKG